jgi:hypothetical protein
LETPAERSGNAAGFSDGLQYTTDCNLSIAQMKFDDCVKRKIEEF